MVNHDALLAAVLGTAPLELPAAPPAKERHELLESIERAAMERFPCKDWKRKWAEACGMEYRILLRARCSFHKLNVLTMHRLAAGAGVALQVGFAGVGYYEVTTLDYVSLCRAVADAIVDLAESVGMTVKDLYINAGVSVRLHTPMRKGRGVSHDVSTLKKLAAAAGTSVWFGVRRPSPTEI